MPRHAGSNGIPPHIRALSVIKLGVPVTPEEIDKAAGFGKYASKHILYLKIDGFEFEKEKDGRKVLSYTLVKEPPNAAALRAMQPKVPKSAMPRPKPEAGAAPKRVGKRTKTEIPKITTDAPVVTIEVPAAAPRAKRSNVSKKTVKALVEKASARLRRRDFDPVSDTFKSTGDVSTSFSIDSDWDSFEDVDVFRLVNA